MLNHPDESRRSRAARLRGALLAAALLAAPVLVLTNCGGAAVVAPFITFEFDGETVDSAGQPQVVKLALFSSDVDQGKGSGSFDSTSLIQTRDPVDGSQLQARAASGAYSGGNFSLSAPGAAEPLAPSYSGQFTEADTITLTPTASGGPTLTLVRVDNSFRPKLDDSHWSGRDAASNQNWTVHFETNPKFNEDAVELLVGTDNLGGTISGFAVMRRIEISIVRGGKTIAMSGRMGPAGQTPPISNDFTAAQTISFSDGSTLKRD